MVLLETVLTLLIYCRFSCMPPSYEASFLAALIQKCSSITSLKQARRLHALLLTATTVSSRSPYLYNNVLSMYARCGSLGDARKVFDKMPQRNLVSFNALTAAYSRGSNTAGLALTLLTQMGVECLRPNVSTFTSILQVEDWLVGSLIHAQVLKFGFLNDLCLQTNCSAWDALQLRGFGICQQSFLTNG